MSLVDHFAILTGCHPPFCFSQCLLGSSCARIGSTIPVEIFSASGLDVPSGRGGNRSRRRLKSYLYDVGRSVRVGKISDH